MVTVSWYIRPLFGLFGLFNEKVEISVLRKFDLESDQIFYHFSPKHSPGVDAIKLILEET